jgi:hypothetical protein
MTVAEAYATVGMRIIERDGSTICVAIETALGEVIVMAELLRIEDRLVIDRVHVDGAELNLPRIRQLAQVFGEVEGVIEVIIQGGVRTSGARPGSSPTPIRVMVK